MKYFKGPLDPTFFLVLQLEQDRKVKEIISFDYESLIKTVRKTKFTSADIFILYLRNSTHWETNPSSQVAAHITSKKELIHFIKHSCEFALAFDDARQRARFNSKTALN